MTSSNPGSVPDIPIPTYSLDFVAAGANRQANSSSWGQNGLVAYSASKFVGIYDPLSQQLLGTLPGHTDRVTSAQWIPNVSLESDSIVYEDEIEIVSSSVDKTLKLWKTNKENLKRRPIRYTLSASLRGHDAPITATAVHVDAATGTVLLASIATDGTVILWRRVSDSFEVLQVLKFGAKLVESVAFASVPGTRSVWFVCGAVDNLVHVFASDETTFKFSKLTTLSGHESWVRSLAFAEFADAKSGSKYLLLASAAQDRRVRLWKFEATTERPQAVARLDPAVLLAQLEANEEGQLEIEQHAIIVSLPSGARWSIALESVILGHDDWVLSASWMPPIRVVCTDAVSKRASYTTLPRLLTASMDKTIVIWTPDPVSGLWVEATRLGEVGGNQLGFFGGLYGTQPYEAVLALGYNGAFHLWKRLPSSTANAAATSSDPLSTIEEWAPEVTLSGHFAEVKDVAWEPNGAYFVSVSKDQTARIWARWVHQEAHIHTTQPSAKGALVNAPSRYNWHELARPLVHGHDLANATFQQGVGHRFIVCAEEKVLRVFDAPTAFLKSMLNLSSGVTLTEADGTRAASANVPALGLSNKPVFEKSAGEKTTASGQEKNAAEKLYEEIHPTGGYGDFDINSDREGHVPLVLSQTAPYEEHLLQRTLWPETAKLYGHGNELVTVTSSRTGDIIASACSCKVQTQEQAGIRIWDTSIWKETCELSGPTLTVTQMQFSHCDRFLLATSRDRGVYLFQRNPENKKVLSLCFANPKAHLRVVWSCSWTWDDQYIATGSRDKIIKIWRLDRETLQLIEVCSVKLKAAVTAVAWLPCKSLPNKAYLLAAGLENGAIQILKSNFTSSEAPTLHTSLDFDPSDVHVDSIKKMAWQARSEMQYDLITCSSDQSVRLFSVSVPITSTAVP
jgi:elongator complex protein 2